MVTPIPSYIGPNGNRRNERLETVTKKPNLSLFQGEIEQALTDANWYYRRNSHAYDWWQSRWSGQTVDGRKHAVMDEPDPFPWEGACFSLDTEILTENGWRSIVDVEVGNRVYSRDEDGNADYRAVTELTRTQSFFGVEFRGKSINLLVTPNHQMLAQNRRGNQQFIRADEFLRFPTKDVWIPLTSKWNGGATPEQICGLTAISFVRLLGWYIANGSMNNVEAVCIGQPMRAAKSRLLEAHLAEAGVTWRYQRNGYWLHSSKLPASFRSALRSLGTAKEKHIPDELLGLNSDLLSELLAVLIRGDGHIRKNGHATYFTISRRLADQVQVLAQLTGKRATISCVPPRGGVIRGRIIKSKYPCYVVRVNSKSTVQARKLLRELVTFREATDFACVNVPPHHTLYVRRNGIAIWCGNSDTRPRTVDRVVREHITIGKYSYRSAKIQAKAIRPFAPPADGQSAKVTQLLTWMIYTHMAGELRREIPLALAWRFGYGASIIGVQWEQARRMEYHEISLPMLDQLAQQGGADPMMMQLLEGIFDPKQEDAFAAMLQQVSPVLTKSSAGKLVRDLRETGTASIPVPYVFKSKPSWRALRPCVDVLFPSDTSDLQEARWVSQREWVNETELRDRIETEEYDKAFVEEACKHKGDSDDTWAQRTAVERGSYNGCYGVRGSWNSGYRDLIELQHFYFKSIEQDTPCIYKTVWCTSAIARRGNSEPLYAKHELFDYQHGLYPFVPLRFETLDRPILSSRGIPEIAYTWEQEIKVQRDGRTDRTAIVNRPALIVPWTKQAAIKGTPLPGAVLGVVRPSEIQYMPLPPSDNSPQAIEEAVEARVQEYFGLFGMELDPDLKKARREELALDILGEVEEVLSHTLALMQQYLPDEQVAKVVGELARPFHVEREEIQGAFEISATIDVHMLDAEYAMSKLDMLGKALAFNTQGTADMSGVFKAAMEIIDPDLAASVVVDNKAATNREIMEEKQAFAQIMAGDEPPLPMNSNHQLRLQTLQGIIGANPRMPVRLQQNPDSKAILENRMKFHQNQLQQQQNAQIGRMQTTQTFNKDAPPATTPGMAALPA